MNGLCRVNLSVFIQDGMTGKRTDVSLLPPPSTEVQAPARENRDSKRRRKLGK